MGLIIGIDPGISGGLAFLWEKETKAISMPKTEYDTFECLDHEVRQYYRWAHYNIENKPRDLVIVILELVHSFPNQGVSSSFTFGRNYGFLRGIIVALKLKLIDVSPQKWMKSLGIPLRKEKTKTEHKNILRQKSQQLFPNLKITLATADALLLAEYGRLLNQKKDG